MLMKVPNKISEARIDGQGKIEYYLKDSSQYCKTITPPKWLRSLILSEIKRAKEQGAFEAREAIRNALAGRDKEEI